MRLTGSASGSTTKNSISAPGPRPVNRPIAGLNSQRTATRVAAVPDSFVDSASSALPDPSSLVSGLQPHFGSRAITQAVDAIGAQVGLPGLLSEGLARERIQQQASQLASGDGLNSLAGNVSTTFQSLRAPSLPSLPSLPSAPSLPSLPSAPSLPTIDLPSLPTLSPPSVSLASPFSALSAALPPLPDIPGVPTDGSLPPHFGTAAAARGVEQLVSWVSGQFSGLELLDPATAASLGGALDQMRGVVGLMTLPQAPSLGAAGGDAAQQLSATATALAAALQGAAAVLPPGGPGAAAVGGLEQLLAAAVGAAEQVSANGISGHSPATLALVAAFSTLAIAGSVPAASYSGPEMPSLPGDQLPRDYDPEAVEAYFARRPLQLASRWAQVATEAASFGSALLLDYLTGRLQANEQARAEQLRGIIERLGPAYVKVAQALSTRVDLLSPAYYTQVQLLQDRVPPFPCEDAKAEMEKAFGRPVDAVFSALSDKPVAAASLGQVYRATLRPELGGGEVAVKVQRPRVLEAVSLDLLIMRRLAVALKEASQMNTDWAAIIDAWAVRFLHEMDYRREADNGELFARQMADAGVEGITVAAVRRDLSTDSVLTTTWVEGEKLSESNAGDIRELCNTLLNAYLISLLDTGFLHADPHPGNLIRTPDGRICVLDFGLMTEVTPEQRVALVEYIAHLSTQDWEKLAVDLQTLGFIPPEVDTRESGLVEPLGRVMSQLVGGGGASKVNIDKVTADLEALGDQYPITVPPFFALILRAFSVIEGIALRVDPDYAIVAECFPYLAKRLLSDDSPRMRAVLCDVLYGNKQRLDVDRLLRVADGLSAFTTDGQVAGGAAGGLAGALGAAGAGAAAAAQQQQAAGARGGELVASTSGRPATQRRVLSPAMVDTLRQALRPGSYVTEILVEEMVAAVDALSRDALSRLVGGLLVSAPAMVQQRSLEALGPLRTVLLPLPTPLEVLARLAPAVAVTPEDQEALGVVRGLLQLAQRVSEAEAASAAAAAPAGGPAGSGAGALRRRNAAQAAQLARELGPILPDIAPGVAYTGDLFLRTFAKRLRARMGEAVALAASGGRAVAGSYASVGSMGGSYDGGSGGRVLQPAAAVGMRAMGQQPGGRAAGPGAAGAAGRR